MALSIIPAFRHTILAVTGAAALACQAAAATDPALSRPSPEELRGMATVIDGYGQWTDLRFHQFWVYDQPYLDALAADPDPKIAANKRAVAAFERALGQALVEHRLEQDIDAIIEKYTTTDYHQMDPNIPDGRKGLSDWFKAGGMHKGTVELPPPPVALIGDGDSVAMILKLPPAPDPDNPSKVYSTYLLSVFRVRDGRISTHYSSAMRGAYYCRIDCGPQKK